MSFYTALSGLNAAQKDIAATSNNIANIGTTGFKASRVEFSDLYSSSPTEVRATAVGSGVRVANVRQEFTQGSVTGSKNSLDMAIKGQGFFALQPSADSMETLYSRVGTFNMDKDGFVVNSNDQYLLGYAVNADGSVASRDRANSSRMQIPISSGAPKATTLISLGVNLPASADNLGGQTSVPPAGAFDPTDPTSYAASTPVQVFDALGNLSTGDVYFTKTQEATALTPSSTYVSRLYVDGEVMETGAGNELSFDMSGAMISPTTAISFEAAAGSTTEPVSIDFSGSSQLATGFSVKSVGQDGYATGGLEGIDVDESGVIWSRYSNGQTNALGKVAIADFTNLNGLQQIGGGAYAATADSGAARFGEASEDGFGMLLSGSIERSNVDLTGELVNLIAAQRNYQASAKALETMSALVQTVMNIRG